MKILPTLTVAELVQKYPKAQIITHTDLDGYTAGAYGIRFLVLLGYRMSDITVTHTNPNTFPFDKNVNLVLITDIGANTSNSIVGPILDATNDPNGPIVIWYDHHQTSVQMQGEYPEMINIYGYRDSSYCSSVHLYSLYKMTYHRMLDTNYYLGKLPAIEFINPDWNKVGIDRTDVFVNMVDKWDRFVFNKNENDPYYLSQAFTSCMSWPKDIKDPIWLNGLCGNSRAKSVELVNVLCRYGSTVAAWHTYNVLNSFRMNGFVGHLKRDVIHNGIDASLMHNISYGGSKAYYPVWGKFPNLIYPYLTEFSISARGCKVTVYADKNMTTQASAADICKYFGGGGHPGCAGISSIPSIYDMLDHIEPLPEKIINRINVALAKSTLTTSADSALKRVMKNRPEMFAPYPTT